MIGSHGQTDGRTDVQTDRRTTADKQTCIHTDRQTFFNTERNYFMRLWVKSFGGIIQNNFSWKVSFLYRRVSACQMFLFFFEVLLTWHSHPQICIWVSQGEGDDSFRSIKGRCQCLLCFYFAEHLLFHSCFLSADTPAHRCIIECKAGVPEPFFLVPMGWQQVMPGILHPVVCLILLSVVGHVLLYVSMCC